MKFSLNMIQYGFDKRNISCELVCSKQQYFQKFLLLDPDDTVISQEYLYIVAENPPASLAVSKYNKTCTILYLKKPMVSPENDYAYITTSISFDYLLNTLIEIINEFNALEYEIMELLIQHKGLQEFIDLISIRMKNPAYIVDSSFKLLAIEQSSELPFISITFKRLIERGYMPINTVVSLLKNNSWIQDDHSDVVSIVDMPQFYCPFIKFKIRFEHNLQGYLFIVSIYHEIHPGEVDCIRLLEPYIVKLFMNHIQFTTSKGSYYEHFFRDVISGSLKDTLLIKEQLIPVNWRINDIFAVLVCPVNLDNEMMTQTIFTRLTHIGDGKPVIMEQKLYCIYDITTTEHWNSQLEQLSILFEQCGQHVGISDPFSGFYHLSQFARQAENALMLGSKAFPSQHFHPYQNYRMQHLIAVCKEHMNLDTFYPRGFLELENYDLLNNTHYFNTLYYYLKNERNITTTAKQLNLHRNSLLYRIDRIKEFTSFDLDNAELRFQLLLAFEIKNILNSVC